MRDSRQVLSRITNHSSNSRDELAWVQHRLRIELLFYRSHKRRRRSDIAPGISFTSYLRRRLFYEQSAANRCRVRAETPDQIDNLPLVAIER